MKEQVLQLLAEGKKRKEICLILGINKTTVSYHLNPNEPARSNSRRLKNNTKQNKIGSRIQGFRELSAKQLKSAINTFNKKNRMFYIKDVYDKFGFNTICYLTGKPINLLTDKFHFDHIIPKAKGGTNDIDNLGITSPEANFSKRDMFLEDYIELCKQVIIHQGYTITKNKKP